MNPYYPPPRSVYVHVPFCAHRCGYCDFTLVAGKDHLIEFYLQALQRDLEQISDALEIDTLFFGGGTPTHLPPDSLQRLVELVREKFHLADGYEFSVEANPADFSAEKRDILADAGVNRISLGTQSFDPEVLSLLERDHRRRDIDAALEMLRGRFENIAMDLIFAVPGQTLELWRQTLQIAEEYQPQHLSTYGLTFEKGTPFWTRREKGKLTSATSDLEREMYEAALEELPTAGFEHYEISNFARPGFRCRHNEVYWTGGSYYGFGPGAARCLEGRRTINHRSVTTWIKRTLAGESSVGETEKLSQEDRAREAIAVGLRRREGIDFAAFRQLTGLELLELAGETVERMAERGWLEHSPMGICLTREGLFFADAVAGEFL